MWGEYFHSTILTKKLPLKCPNIKKLPLKRPNIIESLPKHTHNHKVQQSIQFTLQSTKIHHKYSRGRAPKIHNFIPKDLNWRRANKLYIRNIIANQKLKLSWLHKVSTQKYKNGEKIWVVLPWNLKSRIDEEERLEVSFAKFWRVKILSVSTLPVLFFVLVMRQV